MGKIIYCPLCCKPTVHHVENGHNYEVRRCTECGAETHIRRVPKDARKERERDDDWR